MHACIGHAKGAEAALGIATIFAEVDTTIRTSVNLVNHFVTSGTDEHDRSPHESIDFLSLLCSFWELLNKLVENLARAQPGSK